MTAYELIYSNAKMKLEKKYNSYLKKNKPERINAPESSTPSTTGR